MVVERSTQSLTARTDSMWRERATSDLVFVQKHDRPRCGGSDLASKARHRSTWIYAGIYCCTRHHPTWKWKSPALDARNASVVAPA